MTMVSYKEIRRGLIMNRVLEHYDEALQYFPEKQIVGVFCQGSTNYGLDMPNSDIDTKCIVLPSFKDICLAKKPVSTTHILENNEHLDAKDIRSYVACFRKQNLNFLEILFTDFYIVNPMYKEQWDRLVEAREFIAHMNVHRAVKSMKGIAMKKYHAMEHRYPAKIDIIEKYGYDGKQVSHLIRIYDYLRRYIAGEPYKDCLIPSKELRKLIMDYKMLNVFDLDHARVEAKQYLDMVVELADKFCASHSDQEEAWVRELLEDVSYNIMRISVEKELLK